MTFQRGCYFSNIVFNRERLFGQFKVGESCSFDRIRFKGLLAFNQSEFKTLSFSNIPEDSSDLFVSASVAKELAIEDVKLRSSNIGLVNCNPTIKIIKVNASSIVIAGTMTGEICLSDVHCSGNISLVGFAKPLAFGKDSAFKRIRLKLINVDIEKLNIDYTAFKYEPLDEEDHEIPDHEAILTYEQLLNNFKTNGRRGSYYLLDVEYRKYIDSSPFHWKSRLNEWWWDFGYRPERIFNHVIFFIGLFSIATFLWLKHLQTHIYNVVALDKASDDIYEYNSRNALLRRLWYSFAYTAIVLLLLSIKMENLKLKSKLSSILGTIYVVFLHALGLICLGYIANFIFSKDT